MSLDGGRDVFVVEFDTLYSICTTGLHLPTCNLSIIQHLFSPFSIRLIAHSVPNCTVERKEGCVSALRM